MNDTKILNLAKFALTMSNESIKQYLIVPI